MIAGQAVARWLHLTILLVLVIVGLGLEKAAATNAEIDTLASMIQLNLDEQFIHSQRAKSTAFFQVKLMDTDYAAVFNGAHPSLTISLSGCTLTRPSGESPHGSDAILRWTSASTDSRFTNGTTTLTAHTKPHENMGFQLQARALLSESHCLFNFTVEAGTNDIAYRIVIRLDIDAAKTTDDAGSKALELPELCRDHKESVILRRRSGTKYSSLF